ncbi:hypothetical protein Droror1_Dr00014519 [Drosera rotundifolia]
MQMTISMGIIESDCQAMVNLLKNWVIYRSGVGSVMPDCISLTNKFSSFSCSWVHRGSNHAAHAMANYATIILGRPISEHDRQPDGSEDGGVHMCWANRQF